MTRTKARGIAGHVGSGMSAAVLVALVESRLLTGRSSFIAFIIEMLLLVPLGWGAGLTIWGIRRVVPSALDPRGLVKAVAVHDAPLLSGQILLFGTLGLLTVPLLYHVIYFFMTAFHHPGLASLALTACLIGALAAAYWLRGLPSRLYLSTSRSVSRMLPKRPWIALLLMASTFGVVLLPPLFKGPDATGFFGFMGLLAKDGLNLSPLFATAALFVVPAIAAPFVPLERAPSNRIAGAAALLVTVVAVFLADLLLSRNPEMSIQVDDSEGLAAAVAKISRSVGDFDKDGHGRFMGGRDCNDDDPTIYPRAREIPDNGIDEDCSGADLTLAANDAGSESSLAASAASRLEKPVFPKEVSLFLITIDSLRWDAPGFMGYERNVTPNVDKLVSAGTIYERAYGLGSYTGQAIPPMMTGKYASELHRNDKHEVRIGGDETFAAEVICKEGVICSGILSHFLFKERYGWNQGFHSWKVVDASPPGPGHIDSKYNSDKVADAAIEWLQNPKNTEGPFFLWTHFMDPHKEYLEHPDFKKFGTDRRARYDHEVLYTDHHIGRMLDVFNTLSARQRTVVIVTADHGEAFNEHGRWCHGKELWDEIIRVPLAVVGPGVAKKRIDRPTSHIDIFPTLLDLFGREIPSGMHGRSLLPDWVAGQAVDLRPIVADQPKNPLYETRRVYIKDGWKLHDLPDTGGFRLYRLTGPYEEGESLVATEPEAFARIKAAYEAFLSRELRPMVPVIYDFGSVEAMPLPEGRR